MKQNYDKYGDNAPYWNASIEKIATNAGRHPLFEITGVWITKSELDKIQSINNKVLERLAFVFLCLAKFGNIKNPQNNGWVSMDAKEIFALAHISCNVVDRNVKIGELRIRGLLELPKRNDNMSCRVTFIDCESDNVLEVSDFRELGYEYMKYRGENFIRCSECGVLIRGNKNGTRRYCSACAKYTPKDAKKIVCVDCGKEFWVPGNNKRTVRCEECQSERVRKYDRERKRD